MGKSVQNERLYQLFYFMFLSCFKDNAYRFSTRKTVILIKIVLTIGPVLNNPESGDRGAVAVAAVGVPFNRVRTAAALR